MRDQQIKERLNTAETLKDTNIKEAVTCVDQALYFVITKLLAKLGVYDLTRGGGFMITRSDGTQINRDIAMAQALLFGEDYDKISKVQYISQRNPSPKRDEYDEIFNWIIEIAHKTEEKYGEFQTIIPPWSTKTQSL